MPVNIGKNKFINPREQRDLATQIDNTSWKSWSEVIDLSGNARVQFKNLEGDFPKPSSNAPDRGVLQYYYHLDADSYYRPLKKNKDRGLLSDSKSTTRSRKSGVITDYNPEYPVLPTSPTPAKAYSSVKIREDLAPSIVQGFTNVGTLKWKKVLWYKDQPAINAVPFTVPTVTPDVVSSNIETGVSRYEFSSNQDPIRPTGSGGEEAVYVFWISAAPGGTPVLAGNYAFASAFAGRTRKVLISSDPYIFDGTYQQKYAETGDVGFDTSGISILYSGSDYSLKFLNYAMIDRAAVSGSTIPEPGSPAFESIILTSPVEVRTQEIRFYMDHAPSVSGTARTSDGAAKVASKALTTTYDNAGTPAPIEGESTGTSSKFIVAPNNNSWHCTIVLDDARRDMQNIIEAGKLTVKITTSGQDYNIQDYFYNTNGDSSFTAEYTDMKYFLPFELEFTTNSLRASLRNQIKRSYEGNEIPNSIWIPANSTVEISWSLQEDENEEFPNEDKSYLDVNAADADWETGSPATEDELTWKPQESPNTQPARISIKNTNYEINEEGIYGVSDFSDAHLENVPLTNFVYRALEDLVTLYAGNEVAETDKSSDLILNMQRLAINANYYPSDTGFNAGQFWQEGGPEPKHLWSALSLGYILAQSGTRPLRTQSALDYAMYGNEVDWRSWKNVRKNDIGVFKFKNASGGHVGFIRSVDLATNTVLIAGGNQGNKFKESTYRISSVDMYLLTVRRNWPDPGESFKLI